MRLSRFVALVLIVLLAGCSSLRTRTDAPKNVLTSRQLPSKVFLVRGPALLNVLDCKAPTNSTAVVLLPSKKTRVRKGQKYSVILPSGEVVAARLAITPAKLSCVHPERVSGFAPALLKLSRDITLSKANGTDVLLAVADSKLAKEQIGKISEEALPESVRAELPKLAPKDLHLGGISVGQFISPPEASFGRRSDVRYLVVTTWYLPADIESPGDKATVQLTTFWQKTDDAWTLISKLDGTAHVFAVGDLANDGGLQIGVALEQLYSGTYELRGIQKGALGRPEKTLFSWQND